MEKQNFQQKSQKVCWGQDQRTDSQALFGPNAGKPLRNARCPPSEKTFTRDLGSTNQVTSAHIHRHLSASGGRFGSYRAFFESAVAAASS
ncbi:MAG: hypothetical protein ABFD64_09730 [Armatimonadota bacterium]